VAVSSFDFIVSMSLELANNIIKERLKSGTRKNYESKIRLLSTWLQREHPIWYSAEEDSPILPLPTDILKEFFGYISRKRNVRTGEVLGDTLCAYQTVNGYRSAIKDFYKERKVPFGFDAEDMSNKFLHGYERTIAELKQKGKMSIIEGKRPISFSGYRYLARKALQCSFDFKLGIFAHSFLTLCWNLMARSISVGTMMFCHLIWVDDSLVIHIPRHKGISRTRIRKCVILYEQVTRKAQIRTQSMCTQTLDHLKSVLSWLLPFMSSRWEYEERDRRRWYLDQLLRKDSVIGYTPLVTRTRRK
jgi:hypothetical protein